MYLLLSLFIDQNAIFLSAYPFTFDDFFEAIGFPRMVGEEGKLHTLFWNSGIKVLSEKQIRGYFSLIRLVIITPFTECLLWATHCVVMTTMSPQS